MPQLKILKVSLTTNISNVSYKILFILWKISTGILQGLTTLFERCKCNTMCVWLGFYPTVVSSDPEFIEKILSSTELLNKAKTFYDPVYEAFQGGIISSPG